MLLTREVACNCQLKVRVDLKEELTRVTDDHLEMLSNDQRWLPCLSSQAVLIATISRANVYRAAIGVEVLTVPVALSWSRELVMMDKRESSQVTCQCIRLQTQKITI